ncbi:hypothetical protein [Acinetobacter wuhouensis]|uniref:Uncharacterized protein n=1 Tax=Acinetobacter wuhouensis TaxID=1879050 RepID=A0A4V2DNC2_9GAMM|nr:hypothetical protein [Acinetobacter wuhouensis]RZG47964.1 hypothetical protein EXU28_04145 [Acinetobacter wuhouensis]RZG75490.1 hypothetical protein EXU29_01135 [Acinetobacter wuhouensis]
MPDFFHFLILGSYDMISEGSFIVKLVGIGYFITQLMILYLIFYYIYQKINFSESILEVDSAKIKDKYYIPEFKAPAANVTSPAKYRLTFEISNGKSGVFFAEKQLYEKVKIGDIKMIEYRSGKFGSNILVENIIES